MSKPQSCWFLHGSTTFYQFTVHIAHWTTGLKDWPNPKIRKTSACGMIYDMLFRYISNKWIQQLNYVKLNLFSLVLLVSRCTFVANQITEQPGRWPFALRAGERRGSKNWMGQLKPQISVGVSHQIIHQLIQIPCFYVPFQLDQLAYSCWSKTWKTYLTILDQYAQQPSKFCPQLAVMILFAHSKQSLKVRSQAKYSFGCVLSAYRKSHGVF